jgi:uncharacterized protein (DUF736 family)
MSDYDNTNTGALFKNDKKTTDKHPDYRGQVNVGGVEFWLSAWIKTGKSGKFMSLSVQPKEAQAANPAPKPTGSGFDDMSNSDYPF